MIIECKSERKIIHWIIKHFTVKCSMIESNKQTENWFFLAYKTHLLIKISNFFKLSNSFFLPPTGSSIKRQSQEEITTTADVYNSTTTREEKSAQNRDHQMVPKKVKRKVFMRTVREKERLDFCDTIRNWMWWFLLVSARTHMVNVLIKKIKNSLEKAKFVEIFCDEIEIVKNVTW